MDSTSCMKKQQDVSDILAKDLGKRLIEKDNGDQKVKRIKKVNYDEDLNEFKLKNKTPDEIVANTLEKLASLNELLNHALDKTLGLNEKKTPLNLENSPVKINEKKKSNDEKQQINDTKESNKDFQFKVPEVPTKKSTCKHKKLKDKLSIKETSAKNLVDKLVESQLKNDYLDVKELIEDNKLTDDELIKKHKKKKKDKKEHRCSKHRKRKESGELDELDIKLQDKSGISSSFKNNLSSRGQYFENDDFFSLKDEQRKSDDNYKNYHKDDYHSYYDDKYRNYDDDRYYSRKSSKKYYDQANKYSDDEDYSRFSIKRNDLKYNKYQHDRNKKEFDDKFDYKDPIYMKKLRAENSISNWTKFCSKLSKESANDDNTSICSDIYSDDDDKRSIISERIISKGPLKSKEIKFEVRDFKSRQARSANEIKQVLLEQFPVSSGLNHEWKEVENPNEKKDKKDDKKKKKKTDPKEQELENKVDDFLNLHVQSSKNGFDIGSIMAQRLNALKILENDCNNLTALNQLKEANDLINEWSSKSENNLYNEKQENETNLNKQLTLADQINSENYNICKDFTKAEKSKDGIGMALLVKMGWIPGQGLGKNNEGSIEPIIPELKLDTRGLITDEEKNVAKKNNVQAMYNIPQINKQPNQNTNENLTRIANQSMINGKHPVNILQEVCSKRKWNQAIYTLISEDGPAHKKSFQYKCTLNNVDYLSSFSSPNKKLAKAISAIVCLQSFGLINSDGN